MRSIRVALATLALLVAGLTAVPQPAYADSCGDTQASWIDPTIGSAWSGAAGSDSFTAVLAPAVLGVQAAATVIVPTSGTGGWSYSDHIQWTAAALFWSYRFEVYASACDGSGRVTSAQGGRSDAFSNVDSVAMTRTL